MIGALVEAGRLLRTAGSAGSARSGSSLGVTGRMTLVRQTDMDAISPQLGALGVGIAREVSEASSHR